MRRLHPVEGIDGGLAFVDHPSPELLQRAVCACDGGWSDRLGLPTVAPAGTGLFVGKEVL